MSSNTEQLDHGRTPQAAAPRSVWSAPGSAASLANFAARVLLVILLLAAAYLAWLGMHVLLLTFAGILFAVLLSSLSGWLSQHTGLGHRLSLAIVVVGLLLLASGATWLLANRLAAQLADLTQQLPHSVERIREYLGATSIGRLLLEQAPKATESIAQSGAFSRMTGLVSGVSGFVFGAVVILFVGIFGAAKPEIYRAGFLHLIPLRRRPRVAEAVDAIVHNLRWWMVGQLVLMVTLAATTAVALRLIGVPMALALGVITGLLELIPYVGAWLAALPAALIALLMGPWYAVTVLALFLGLHILEGYLLAPLIQSRAIHLPPAFTLVAQVLLGEVAGVVGLLVAAPLTVGIVVAVKMLYIEDALGDESVEENGAPGDASQPKLGDGARGN